jgi:hypothetical protein
MSRAGEYFDERLKALEALAHKLISHEDPEVKAAGEDVSKAVAELRSDAPALEAEVKADAEKVAKTAEKDAGEIAADVAKDA